MEKTLTMKRYSVSLLYQRRSENELTNFIRVEILYAVDEPQALGKSLLTFDEEMKKEKATFSGCKVIIEIK